MRNLNKELDEMVERLSKKYTFIDFLPLATWAYATGYIRGYKTAFNSNLNIIAVDPKKVSGSYDDKIREVIESGKTGILILLERENIKT